MSDVRRIRVMFCKGEEIRYISHLDLMRTWERTLRRAGVRLAYTQGFSPHPRLVFAAPLSVGVTSDAEMVDVFIDGDLAPDGFKAHITEALPPGIRVQRVEEVPSDAPPVVLQVSSADYLVDVVSETGEAAARAAVGRLLSQPAVPYQRTRKGVARTADLRPLVLKLNVEQWAERKLLAMRLRLDREGAAVRPDEVVRALDSRWQVRRIHRSGLILGDAPVASIDTQESDSHAA